MEETQNTRISNRLRLAAWGIIAAIVVAIVFLVRFFTSGATYSTLKTTEERTMENALSSAYCEMNHNVLRYGTDGAALLDRSQRTLWETSYKMTSPQAVVCSGTVALYNEGGSEVLIYNERGKLGSVTTEMPVQKAAVSEQGTVATLQGDGNSVWIRYYSSSGEEISAIKTSMAEPGYPMDFALSRDGMLLAVSYLSYEEDKAGTSLVFYQFGSFGQDQMDNIVGQFDLEEALVPQVEYLDEQTAVAFRDDGFAVYRGDTRPERIAQVRQQEEIESVFCSANHIGLITRKETGSELFALHIYDLDGTERATCPLDFVYDSVEFSGNQVSLYKDQSLCVYDLNGNKKYEGTCDGDVKQFFSLDTRQYIVSDDEGIRWLRLQ